MRIAMEIWNADLTFKGNAIITLFVFLLMFMLMGRFRLAFVCSIFFVYYEVFIENRNIFEKNLSLQGATGAFVAAGAICLGLCVWCFFIESD